MLVLVNSNNSAPYSHYRGRLKSSTVQTPVWPSPSIRSSPLDTGSGSELIKEVVPPRFKHWADDCFLQTGVGEKWKVLKQKQLKFFLVSH